MKVKNSRLETLKMLISSQELSSQDQLLQALAQEGFEITQATLSRDLKLLHPLANTHTYFRTMRSTSECPATCQRERWP
mgnify:CR=1 FL=1